MKQNMIYDTLGRPMHDLRISLTDRCNFNCTYCMPDKDMEFLPRKELLSFEEIEQFVKIATKLGVRKIKLTGGEPTLRVGLDVLIKKLKAISGIEDIGLITNGHFIKSIGHRLREAGLDRISISIDAIDNRVFQSIVGNSYNVHPVLEGIAYAKELGFSPIKINCVILKGVNESEILPLVKFFREPVFHLRFIEFMDVGNIEWNKDEIISSKNIFDIINTHFELEPVERDYFGEVAQRYRYKDGKGEVGFISSVTNSFCSDCTRLRLSSDGVLYGCLFTDKGTSVKDIFRDEGLSEAEKIQGIEDLLRDFWQKRDDRYSDLRQELRHSREKKNMNFLGG